MVFGAVFLTAPNTAEAVIPPLKPPTLQERAVSIAKEEDFDPQIVINNINTETGGTWDCSIVGTSGELGCLQIIPKYHKVDPLNFDAAVRYFISEYKAGRGWQWTGCSCIQSARLTVKDTPVGNASDLVPNSTMQEGKLALLRYGDQYHVVAYKIAPEGLYAVKEGNFKPCAIKDRLIPWSEVSVHLVGFLDPTTSP